MKPKQRTLLRNQRVLLPLIALAVLLFILALSSAGNTVYAADPADGPAQMWPGEGGGGGGGGGSTPPPSNMIEGYIIQYNSYNGVLGIPVIINDGYTELNPVLTDANGHFVCSNYYLIKPYCWYSVEVNGRLSDLAHNSTIPQWGQCRGMVQTDGNGYASVNLPLDSSTVVNVPAAAMYSNSQYATLKYVMGSTDFFEHTLSFKVSTFGISDGYMTGTIAEHGFTAYPLGKFIVCESHYAATCYDAVQKKYWSGIDIKVAGASWGVLPTTEYITDPSSLDPSNCEDFTCARLGSVDGTFSETSAHTWSGEAGVPFAVIFQAFGKMISLDVTVQSSSGTTSTLYYKVDMSNADTSNILKFRVYRVTGEIHCWEMGVAG